MAINMEKIEKMPLPQKALIVAVLILLIYVLYYFLSASGQYKIIKEKTTLLERKQSDVAKGKAVLQEIERYKAIQAKLENQLKDAEKKLPKQAEIPQLLDTVSDLARGNQLVLSNFHPDQKAVSVGGLYQQIYINIDFQGDYQRVAEFLNQVSKLERIINVEKISLAPISKGASLKATTRLVTYMFGGS